MFSKAIDCRRAGRLVILLLACQVSSTAALAQLTAAKVVLRQETGADLPAHGSRTIYSLNEGTDHAELIVDRLGEPRLKPELRFNVWRGEPQSHRDDATLPIERRLAFFRPMMDRLLATEKPEAAYGLLFYGYRELYERLPTLAAGDTGWDRRLGRPVVKRQGYGYFEDLLSRGEAYRELASAAAALHYRVAITGGMEALRVLPVSKLTEEQRKGLPPGLKETDLLPSRIVIEFTLTRER